MHLDHLRLASAHCLFSWEGMQPSCIHHMLDHFGLNARNCEFIVRRFLDSFLLRMLMFCFPQAVDLVGLQLPCLGRAAGAWFPLAELVGVCLTRGWFRGLGRDYTQTGRHVSGPLLSSLVDLVEQGSSVQKVSRFPLHVSVALSHVEIAASPQDKAGHMRGAS